MWLKKDVLLLRQEEENDKYHLRFQQDAIIQSVHSVPVLSFEYYNIDMVKTFIENIDQYSGMIFTSRRAITAFGKAITSKQLANLTSMTASDFSIYVVGRTTADCLGQLGLSSKGAETGNAKELSELIVNEQRSATKPLMFLCGNLARETIPTRLTENKIPNACISCYKTIQNEDFDVNLKQYLDRIKPNVIVFFSPSGAEFHLMTIKRLIPDMAEAVKVIGIGDYTSEGVSRLGVNVAGVAVKPTPDGLFDVIQSL